MKRLPAGIILAIGMTMSLWAVSFGFPVAAMIFSGITLVYILMEYILSTRAMKKGEKSFTERQSLNMMIVEEFYKWLEKTFKEDIADLAYSPNQELTKLSINMMKKDGQKPLTIDVELLTDDNAKDLSKRASYLMSSMQETVNLYMNDQLPENTGGING